MQVHLECEWLFFSGTWTLHFLDDCSILECYALIEPKQLLTVVNSSSNSYAKSGNC